MTARDLAQPFILPAKNFFSLSFVFPWVPSKESVTHDTPHKKNRNQEKPRTSPAESADRSEVGFGSLSFLSGEQTCNTGHFSIILYWVPILILSLATYFRLELIGNFSSQNLKWQWCPPSRDGALGLGNCGGVCLRGSVKSWLWEGWVVGAAW